MEIDLGAVGVVLAVYAYVLALIVAAELARREFSLKSTFTRHIIHLFAGVSILVLPLCSEWYYPFMIPLGLGVVVGLALTFAKSSFITTSMVDQKEHGGAHAYGPLYYIVSIGVLVLLGWGRRDLVMASVMIMAWGDGAASTFAPLIKDRHRYPFSQKSVEGSLLMLVAGFLGATLALVISSALWMPVDLGRILMLASVGSVVGTVVEMLTVGPLQPFDNFTVPFAAFVAMCLL
jgi:phytol kinase